MIEGANLDGLDDYDCCVSPNDNGNPRHQDLAPPLLSACLSTMSTALDNDDILGLAEALEAWWVISDKSETLEEISPEWMRTKVARVTKRIFSSLCSLDCRC